MNLMHVAGVLTKDQTDLSLQDQEKITRLEVVSINWKNEQFFWEICFYTKKHQQLIPFLKKDTEIYAIGVMETPEIHFDQHGNKKVILKLDASILKLNFFPKKNSNLNFLNTVNCKTMQNTSNLSLKDAL